MKILFIGDIFSVLGREMIDQYLENIRITKNINFIIANGENIAHGNGITNNYYKFLLERKLYHFKYRKIQNKNIPVSRFQKDVKYYYHVKGKIIDEKDII